MTDNHQFLLYIAPDGALGYRVNSYQAIQFRIWATKTLREFIVKGFVPDDGRLKQGKTLFGVGMSVDEYVQHFVFVQQVAKQLSQVDLP